MTYRYPIGLFGAYGVELEYMIVDRGSLDVRPIADRLLGPDGDLERGPVTWSNELALHVIELKNTEPTPTLSGLGALFQEAVREVNRRLAAWGACLLPTGMHPWMDPEVDFRPWPHAGGDVYRTFDRIFDCRGHGWANLQSVHLNLPFADDEEFGRLHAAVRLVLPILPALAASSPAREGGLTGFMDTRLEVYRHNADRVPSVGGVVIPERVFTRRSYEDDLLGGIYRDLEPLDPEHVLRHEWVNARGAIARFDRGTIEIRVLDVQECPGADVAVAGATASVVRALAEKRFARSADQRAWPEHVLARLLESTLTVGDGSPIVDAAYLEALGYPKPAAMAHELWQHLIETFVARDPLYPEWKPFLDTFVGEGCLARRIRAAVGETPDRASLGRVYAELAGCLDEGHSFSGLRKNR